MPRPDNTLFELEPKIGELGTLYRVRHHVPTRNFSDTGYVDLLIDDRYVQFTSWYWFGTKSPEQGIGIGRWTLTQRRAYEEIQAWLMYHELIELKPIGPEDSEYFATDKLVGGSTVIEVDV